MSELDERELRSRRLLHYAPGESNEDQALRECALLSYPESHAKMLREIFPALDTIYGEEHAGGDYKYGGSYTKAQLRAAVQDLRYTARFLARVASTGIDAVFESDQRLGWLADRLAVHVENLAELVEKRIVPKRKRGTDEAA